MNAVADAAIALRLRYLSLSECSCEDETIPALTRIVYAGFLRFLTIYDIDEVLFDDDDEDTHRFCDAVRATPSLGIDIYNGGQQSAALTNGTRTTAIKQRRLNFERPLRSSSYRTLI